MMRNELQPIADAQHRLAQSKHGGIGIRRIGVIDRTWATGEDDTERLIALNFRKLRRAGQHDGKDILLANAARDELSVLRAKIQDDDRRGVHALFYNAAVLVQHWSILEGRLFTLCRRTRLGRNFRISLPCPGPARTQ